MIFPYYDFPLSLRFVAVPLWDEVVDTLSAPSDDTVASPEPVPALAALQVEMKSMAAPHASTRVFRGFDWAIEADAQPQHGPAWQHLLECARNDATRRRLEHQHLLIAPQQCAPIEPACSFRHA